MSSAASTRSAILPAGNAIGNMTAPLPIRRRRSVSRSSVSPSAEWPRPSMCPTSCNTMDSTSWRPVSPPAATDHGKLELSTMSDSTISPVISSMRNDVSPSTVSSSSGTKPIADTPSSTPGFDVDESNELGSDGRRSRSSSRSRMRARWRPRNSAAGTPGTSRLVTKYRTPFGHRIPTTVPPMSNPIFRYASEIRREE